MHPTHGRRACGSQPMPATGAALLLALVWLPVSACGSGPASPLIPFTPTAATPPETASGHLTDLQATRDIIDWNMNATGGASYRTVGRTCRWQLPVRVRLEAGPDAERVTAALDYWRAEAGMTYELVASDDVPRVLIRCGTDGLAPWGGGRSVLDGTYADNRARSGLVVYEPGGGTYCAAGVQAPLCLYLYRHELGHVFGIFTNTDDGLMSSGTDLTTREKRMLAALYSIPCGAVVDADGSWRVPVS